jgi:DNA polymerase-3 subunit gamma/tau
MYQDKLSLALQQHFGRKIRLEFNVEGSVNTPAKQVAQEKAEAQAGAENAIEEDSFVRALINDFGASIIPNSVKPISN